MGARHRAQPSDRPPASSAQHHRFVGDLAERYARSHEVRSALIRLPEEQREVLVLAYFGGYTQSQIATYLDLPLGTVKARAFRGLRRLAKLLLP
jgi:RNA polymerase sigma factor (sigma-70 family)